MGRPKKSGAAIAPAPYAKTIPSDGVFPQYALLINQLTHGAFRMRYIERADVLDEGPNIKRTMESRVCEAHLFKGIEVRFLDGKPSGKRPTVTVIIDSETVVDREPASTFSGEDPQFKVKDSTVLFLAAADSGRDEADIDAPKMGYFLPHGTNVWVHVETSRPVESRLIMGRYSS